MALKVGEYLGDGWTVAHVADAKSTTASGPGNQVITVTPGNYEAHKRVGDTLYVQQGADEKELKERIDYWNTHQPTPNPLTEDSNRVLSAKEKLISAEGTLRQHITIGARPGAEADLTEAADKPKPEAAILTAHPTINVEKVKGDDAAGIVAAAQGLPAPEAPAGPTETPASSPKSSRSRSSSSKSSSSKSSSK